MEWGTTVQWGWFLLFSRCGGHKTKETYPTRPGSPTPCKQGLSRILSYKNHEGGKFQIELTVRAWSHEPGKQWQA